MKSFRAIGAFDPLFGRVAMRYAAIRTIRFPEREFLLSLQNLTRTVQPDGQLLQLLCYDLSRLDQKNSMAACSPASDNMGEVMQHTGTYSDDEIERILSSGTSMDQQMMARVLRKIIRNLQDHIGKGYLQFDSYPAWFWRLRSFDEPTFDTVLHEWLDSSLTGHQMYTLQIAVPSLVASGCMTLSNLLDTLRASIAPSKRGQLAEPSVTATEGLRMLLPSGDLNGSCSLQDAYRYRLEQHKLCFDTDTRIIQCIGDVAELVTSLPSPKMQQDLSIMLSSQSVLSVVRQHIVSDSDVLSKMSPGLVGLPVASRYLRPMLNGLLDPARSSREYLNLRRC